MSKLRLMANLPIYVDKIPIYSPTLRSIAEIDKETYQKYLNCATISKDQIEEKNEKITDYDVLIASLSAYDELLYCFLDSLFYFTKIKFGVACLVEDKSVIFTSENGSIQLNCNNYSKFIKTVKFVNFIESQDVEELDEFDRLLLERERKVLEAQNKNKEVPMLEDLISAVANMDGNGLNIINIWDLNIYQFYEQLRRGQLKETYKFDLQQVLVGVKPEELDIKTYISNLE